MLLESLNISLRQARRKRCGMAAVAAPKICRERERKGREERKEIEKRRKKGGEKGKEMERRAKEKDVFTPIKTPP